MLPDLLRALALALMLLALIGVPVALWRLRHCSAMQRIVCGPALIGNAQGCGLVAALLLIGLASTAHAADVVPLGPTQVSIPWGQWIADLAPILVQIAGAAALAALSWLAAKLPAPIAAALRTSQTEQLLRHSIGYGINAVAGAARDGVWTVDVGNKVVAEASAYAVRNGPSVLIGWLGGLPGIQVRIIARLPNIDSAASVTSGVAFAAPAAERPEMVIHSAVAAPAKADLTVPGNYVPAG